MITSAVCVGIQTMMYSRYYLDALRVSLDSPSAWCLDEAVDRVSALPQKISFQYQRPENKHWFKLSDKSVLDEIARLDTLETRRQKLVRKLHENPFLGAGLVGLMTVVTVGGYRFNRRPANMSASQYLMQLRVLAQGTTVGCLATGVAYTLYDQYLRPKKQQHAKQPPLFL